MILEYKLLTKKNMQQITNEIIQEIKNRIVSGGNKKDIYTSFISFIMKEGKVLYG